ncbi:hypothetical protein BBP40_006149 [Aspergillus hancockii]|nr:hypothetical protein BBP40_006149 [Aspergillus hancockii]
MHFGGIETVLLFLSILDPDSMVRLQKNLINAAIQAGVRRFTPSEGGSRGSGGMALYRYKDAVREYLETVNCDEKTLEYYLFQPGYFTNYFGWPHSTTKHFTMTQTYIDLDARHAILIGDGNYEITLTTVQDLGGIVADALDYPGEWPVEGGIRGSQITMGDLLRLGERLRGPFTVERVTPEEREFKTDWYPIVQHPSISKDRVDEISKMVTLDFVQGAWKGGWSVSDEWNKLLPNYQFTSVEAYLEALWKGEN